jgi:hypothetical protein
MVRVVGLAVPEYLALDAARLPGRRWLALGRQMLVLAMER